MLGADASDSDFIMVLVFTVLVVAVFGVVAT